MSTTKKITKRDKFNALAAMLNDFDPTHVIADGLTTSDLAEFISHEIDLLTKKNSADKKPTAKQEENKGIQQAILDGMADNRLYTITEIQKEVAECTELTNQRISAIVRQMVGVSVERIEDKRKAYFRKIAK